MLNRQRKNVKRIICDGGALSDSSIAAITALSGLRSLGATLQLNCLACKFVATRAGGEYDARDAGPNQKFLPPMHGEQPW